MFIHYGPHCTCSYLLWAAYLSGTGPWIEFLLNSLSFAFMFILILSMINDQPILYKQNVDIFFLKYYLEARQ